MLHAPRPRSPPVIRYHEDCATGQITQEPIQAGERLPSATLFFNQHGEVERIRTQRMSNLKRIIIFSAEGTFRPAAHQHVQNYINNVHRLGEAYGIDHVFFVTADEPHAVRAFVESLKGVKEHVSCDDFAKYSDSNLLFAKSLGLVADRRASGYGLGLKLFTMVVHDGLVEYLAVDENDVHAKTTLAAMEDYLKATQNLNPNLNKNA